MADLDLDAIRRRCDAATPGPWFWNSYSGIFSTPFVQRDEAFTEAICETEWGDREYRDWPEEWQDRKSEERSDVAHVPPHHGDTAIGRQAADADFIAHAREDVPALLAEIERLRGELRDLGDRYFTDGEAG